MYNVDAQLSLCTDVDQSLCTSTNPDLYCLVVTAPSGSRQVTIFIMVMAYRCQARRGQPVAQSVTQQMPVRDRESHREKDREMLARVKEFDGDDNN